MKTSKNSPSNTFIFKQSGLISRNRAVLSVMTNKQSLPDGTISQQEIAWLTHRARGGFGIITTAAAHVSKHGQGWEGELGVFDDKHINQLKVLTKSIHKYDSLVFAQVFHGGMRSPQSITGLQPISASIVPSEVSDTNFSYQASESDINKIIHEFTHAAIRCYESGFDGIEIHGAHGYLISQFLATEINQRADVWGGGINNRSKLLIDICRSIQKNVPNSFVVGVRISPEIPELGIALNDSINLVSILKDEGLDFIHISCWDAFSRSKAYPNNRKTLTEWFTENINGLPPIISTGSVWSTSDAQNLMNQGADLIGVGRVAIAHPNWANNLSDNNYSPQRPPFSIEHLQSSSLSDVFIEYMKNWTGFVKNTNN